MVSSPSETRHNLTPQLSVIVPVYRTEHFLEQCLNTLSRCAMEALEIIVVDDAPSERCRQIVDTHRTKDARIRYLRNPTNTGLFEARRKGVEAARAPYIAFLDPDDRVDPAIYEKACQQARDAGACIVLFNAKLADESGKEWTEAYNTVPAFRGHSGEQLLGMIFSQHATAWAWHVNWNKIISKSALLAAYGNFDGQRHLVMYEDLLLSCALYLHLMHQRCIAAIADVGITYVLHADSATQQRAYTARLKRTDDALYVLKAIERLLRRHHVLSNYEKDFAQIRRLLLSRFRPLPPEVHTLDNWRRYLGSKLRHLCLATGSGPLIKADMSLDEAESLILEKVRRSAIDGDIAIYGTGSLGQRLHQALTEDGYRVCCFVSSVTAPEGKMDALPVLGPADALRCGVKVFIIASVGSYLQIRNLLDDEAKRAATDIRTIGIR